jgi:hypothetical protein
MIGSAANEYIITNPVGTTFRYTYNATGTNPNITALTHPVGAIVVVCDVESGSTTRMDNDNTGYFVVTGSGANYFEVTNASGFAETNTMQTGVFIPQTWTKPSGLKYVVVEIQAPGGWTAGGTGANGEPQPGGGGGGYSRKKILAASLGATETVTLGGTSSFGSHFSATAGSPSLYNTTTGGSGGGATGGDVNIPGAAGQSVPSSSQQFSGGGGASHLGCAQPGQIYDGTQRNGIVGNDYGAGSVGGSRTTNYSGAGVSRGIVIVTEYF